MSVYQPRTQRFTSHGGGIHHSAYIGGPPEHRDFTPDDHALEPDIHPTARIEAFVTVDAGMKIPTRVGAGTWLMKKVHIGHDAWIGDNCEIAPGTVIGGHVKLGHRVRCGIGVMVRPGVTVGEGARLGAGAVVVKDVPPGEIWCGNPARPLSAHHGQVGTSGQTVHNLTAP